MEKEIGRMQSDIEYLKKDGDEIKATMRSMQEDLTEIKETLVKTGSLWKVIVAFGAFCAAAGGLIINFFSVLKQWF